MTHLFRKILISAFIGLFAAVIFGYLSYARIGFLEKFENGTFDLKMAASRKYHPERNPANDDVPVVFFDIDDNSLINKEFPLPRDEYAKAIRVLKQAGAKVIGFDIIFPEVAQKRVSYNRLDDLHQNVENIMTSSEISSEDKEWKIHDKIDEAYEWDVDRDVAKASREHGHVYFPLAFSNESLVPSSLVYEEMSVEAKKNAKSLFYYMLQNKKKIHRWFDSPSGKDRTALIEDILTETDELRRVQVSPLLIREINRELTESVINILKEGSGLDLSNIAGIANHLDSEGRKDGFDLVFSDQQKIDKVLLLKAYDRILDNQIYKDIIANFNDKEVCEAIKSVLKREPTIGDVSEFYYNRVLYDSFSSEWVRGFGIAGDFHEVDKSLREFVILQSAYKNSELSNSLPFSYECTPPILPYLSAQPLACYIQIQADDDGVVRHWPLLRAFQSEIDGIEDRQGVFPIMSLQLLLDYLGVSLAEIEIKLGDHITIPTHDGKKYTFPIDYRGRMILNWISGDFKEVLSHFSFKLLMDASEKLENDAIDEDKRISEYNEFVLHSIAPLVKGKIVLIGLTAIGSHDMNPTSLSSRFPMVSAHGNCIANILCDSAIRRVCPTTDFLITALILLFLSLLLSFLPYLYSTIIAGLSILGYALSSYYLQLNGYWVNTFYVQSGLIVCSATLFAAKYAIEGRSRAVLKKLFSTYLSPKLVEQMADKLPTLKLGGASMEATVYFSDIAAFTTLSESLSPQELVELLNRYLTLMTDNILENEGMLDKYIGDAVVAAFGVPFEDAQHARRACIAAIANNASMQVLNESLKAEGKPILNQRIGISSGPLVAGNMGSERRLSYTVMGDTVNLGSRMENANKYYGSKIMMSASTFSMIDDEFVCRRLDKLKVVGKNRPVEVYELIDFSSNLSDERISGYRCFEDGLADYFSRNWQDAIEKFEKAKKILGGDMPCDVFVARCEEMQKNPPPENWDGVFELRTK